MQKKDSEKKMQIKGDKKDAEKGVEKKTQKWAQIKDSDTYKYFTLFRKIIVK